MAERRAAGPRRQKAFTPAAPEDQEQAAATRRVGGTAKSITLRHGEVVTLSATADFFAMEEEDQVFLFGILKQLKDYERKSLSRVPSGKDQTDAGGEE